MLTFIKAKPTNRSWYGFITPPPPFLFKKNIFFVGCVRQYEKKLFQMYCVFYIFCFLKLQIVWKQGWQHPSEAPEKKLWEDKRAKWTELANIRRSKNQRGRKLTIDIHETFIRYTLKFLLHDLRTNRQSKLYTGCYLERLIFTKKIVEMEIIYFWVIYHFRFHWKPQDPAILFPFF